MADFTAENVIQGSGKMYIAPIGTALPTLSTSTTLPLVWPAGWKAVGYTDDGVTIAYTPTFKDVVVDEEMAPIDKILTAEKAVISAKLAEATLVNLKNAISGSTLATAKGSPEDTTTLKVGSSAANNKVMVGFEGPAPSTQQTRVVIAYKAKAIGAISLHYQRTDKLTILGEFEVLADPTKPAGERLFEIVDLGQEVES